MPAPVCHSACLHVSVSKICSVSLDVCQELKRFRVNTLVRVCDATYDKAPVEKEGIQVVVSVAHVVCGFVFCVA